MLEQASRRVRIRPMTVKRVVTIFTMVLTVSAVAGCQDKPFMDETARSPYTRYSLLRGKYRPTERTDEFGVKRKALEERLSPLETSY